MEISLKTEGVNLSATKAFTVKVRPSSHGDDVTKHSVASHAASVARRFTGVQTRVSMGRDSWLVTFSARSNFQTSTIIEIVEMMQSMQAKSKATRQQKDKARKQQKPTRMTGGALAKRNGS